MPNIDGTIRRNKLFKIKYFWIITEIIDCGKYKFSDASKSDRK